MYNGVKPIPQLSIDRLRELTRPNPGGMEAFKHVLYDTQDYPAAGAAGLNFYAAGQADRTRSNIPQSGQLEADNYFIVERLFLNFLADLTLTATISEAGVMRDIHRVMNVARGVGSWRQDGKTHLTVPLSMIGQAGGILGQPNLAAAPAAGAAAIIQAPIVERNGGFPIDGGIIVRPETGFAFAVDFAAAFGGALVAIAAALPIQVQAYGTYFRPVR